MDGDPFGAGTKQQQVFVVLSDGEWHCGRHELPGTQPAKAIQIMRQRGYEVENKTQYCVDCSERTVHRRLVSTSPSGQSYVRATFPARLRQRVLRLHRDTDAIMGREIASTQLEVDHRFPQVRWSSDEELDPDMPDEEIRKRFQLLTRSHNLWKSRHCERCVGTGVRGTFIGIEYFAKGGPQWDPNIPADDERGCHGCFWFDPVVWKESLNERIRSGSE